MSGVLLSFSSLPLTPTPRQYLKEDSLPKLLLGQLTTFLTTVPSLISFLAYFIFITLLLEFFPTESNHSPTLNSWLTRIRKIKSKLFHSALLALYGLLTPHTQHSRNRIIILQIQIRNYFYSLYVWLFCLEIFSYRFVPNLPEGFPTYPKLNWVLIMSTSKGILKISLWNLAVKIE